MQSALAINDPVIEYAKAFDAEDKAYDAADEAGDPDLCAAIGEKMNDAEEKMVTTPAISPEGIEAQIKSLLRFLDTFEDMGTDGVKESDRRFKVISAGLQNLQSKQA